MKEKKAPSSNTASFSENIFIPVVFCLSSVYTAILLKISAAINEIQTVPYIDEIYHVPQAQEYCKGNFLHVRTSHILYIFKHNCFVILFISVG